MMKARQTWIDEIKILACILVAMGHFFQSMVAGKILSGGGVHQWFIQTIYYFHVPLFFICSGFLYQKGHSVRSFDAWKTNALKKLISLGVPYFTFSLITWLLKTVFSGSVNSEVGGLGYSLFVHPLSPYWYLYTLFFLFLLIPTFSQKRDVYVGLGAALGLKSISIFFGGTSIFAISSFIDNSIWFVLGMSMCAFDIPQKIRKYSHGMKLGAGMALVFLILSVLVSYWGADFPGLPFLMGLLACTAVITLFISAPAGTKHTDIIEKLSEYTMPVFLMHTIFAAGLRSVLLHISVRNAAIHVVCGLAISFLGPIAVSEIMKRVKFLDFFLYPGKYIKIERTQRETNHV